MILTNCLCQCLVIFESTCDGALRCNDYNWKCSLRWKVAMTSRVTCSLIWNNDLKGWLFLDVEHMEYVDDVKGYLFLDAVLQLTESVLLLLRQLPIWTLHRLAWDVSIINLCTRINIYITEGMGYNRKYFMKMLIGLNPLLYVFNAFAVFLCSVYKSICYVFSSSFE